MNQPQHTPQSIIRNYKEVGSLPAVFAKINEAVQNPNTSVNALGNIISEDTGLTIRLLRMANSAFYGLPRKVDTVSRAVVTLGMQQIRDMALATSVIKMFSGIPENLVNMQGFWQHSIACAMFARNIAVLRRCSNVERFFVAGLLHDVGRLVMFKKVTDCCTRALEMTRNGEILLHEAEQKVLGFDHAAVARALMEAWDLPSSLIESVGNHHAPTCATAYPIEAAVVHIADVLAHVMRAGTSGERLVPPLNKKAWQKVQMQVDALDSIVAAVEQQLNELAYVLLSE